VPLRTCWLQPGGRLTSCSRRGSAPGHGDFRIERFDDFTHRMPGIVAMQNENIQRVDLEPVQTVGECRRRMTSGVKQSSGRR